MATAKRKHVQPAAETVIPEKIYFRIGEVSELAKLPTYVLRFWETEFPQLRPIKSNTGQRMYRRRDVESVMQIRKLLYEDGFTIAGARERLREEMRNNRAESRTAQANLNAVTAPAAPQVVQEAQRGTQAALPFASGTFTSDKTGTQNHEELQRVRQQLSEVLALLS